MAVSVAYGLCVYGNLTRSPSGCPSLVHSRCDGASRVVEQCASRRLCPMYREWLPPHTQFVSNPRPRTIADHATVEVFRCSETRKHACGRSCRESYGAWMFVAPGSGVFYNTGRVITFTNHTAAAAWCDVRCENHHCLGGLTRVVRCLRGRGFDTAAFSNQSDAACGRIATELVDLGATGSLADCRANSTRVLPGATCEGGCTVPRARARRDERGDWALMAAAAAPHRG